MTHHVQEEGEGEGRGGTQKGCGVREVMEGGS